MVGVMTLDIAAGCSFCTGTEPPRPTDEVQTRCSYIAG